MECVDKSIHGCENDIKHTVESYYEETLDYFEGLCAREVKAPENQSGSVDHREPYIMLCLCYTYATFTICL